MTHSAHTGASFSGHHRLLTEGWGIGALATKMESIMDIIKQILDSVSGTLPTDSKTAAAIARNASPEEISTCASEEGLHALAGSLFEACEESGRGNAALDNSAHVSEQLTARLREFRNELPADCETARLIDAGGRLEEISEAAQKEGLTSLASMLFEAEQEEGGEKG